MNVSQKIDPSAKAIEGHPCAGPPTILSLTSRNRSTAISVRWRDILKSICCREHPEKRPASLPQMSVDDTSSKIVEEISAILHENEKRSPSLIEAILQVVVKEKKKVKESYINMMSYPHSQDSPNF